MRRDDVQVSEIPITKDILAVDAYWEKKKKKDVYWRP